MLIQRESDRAATNPRRPTTSRHPLRLGVIAGTLRGCATVALSEPEILGLGQVVRPGDVCLDIGAAYGMYTYPLARLVGPEGAVHSFEPLPNSYRILAAGRRASGAGHVHVHNVALGPERGTRDMTLPYRFGLPIHGWAFVRDGLRRPPRAVSFGSHRTLSTRVRTVDEVRADHGPGRVRFLKVDVEGFEGAVLSGAERTLDEDRPALLLEIENRHLDKYGMTPRDLVESLRGRGYTMYTWRGHRWTRTAAVTTQRRNYLFATEETWQR